MCFGVCLTFGAVSQYSIASGLGRRQLKISYSYMVIDEVCFAFLLSAVNKISSCEVVDLCE